MFGPLPQELALVRPAVLERWLTVARPVLSSTAGIVLGALLVAGAALRLAPEPLVTPVVEAPVAPAIAAVVQPIAPVQAVAPSAPPVVAPPAVPVAAPPVAAAAPPPAISATPYRSGGRAYAALVADPGATIDAPLAGRIEVRLYQLISGQVRTGANVAGLAYYPYVLVRSNDRVLTLRPGALDVDTELLVKDGAIVTAGTPLLRVTGAGASSWRSFYDRTLEAQVVASLTNAAGADLDAVSLFARH